MVHWQTEAALPVFGRLLKSQDELMGDLLEWFDADPVFYGAKALPTLKEALFQDASNSWAYGKSLSAGLLVDIARRDPETRSEVIEILRAYLPDPEILPEEADEIWGEVAMHLGELGDEESTEQILALDKVGVLSWESFAEESYRELLATGFEPLPPLPEYDIVTEYVTFEARERRAEEQRTAYRQRMSQQIETQRRSQPKIGRNAPCPCGSGKKYKKCHGRPGAEPLEV